jgi:putative NADPH-quinone reductase
MARRIAIIQGHPDPQGHHFGLALADAYAIGAAAVGGDSTGPRQIGWADHLLIFYPLWLGSMLAILKAFLERVFRPGFAISKSDQGKSWKKLLSGKSARIVVTIGMPALLYRRYFRAHSLKRVLSSSAGNAGWGGTEVR